MELWERVQRVSVPDAGNSGEALEVDKLRTGERAGRLSMVPGLRWLAWSLRTLCLVSPETALCPQVPSPIMLSVSKVTFVTCNRKVHRPGSDFVLSFYSGVT
jgi:hypothetical protein